MSLPSFSESPNDLSFETSILQILSSIAMEEIGLSHTLNAEGEKLQYILGTLLNVPPPDSPSTVDELIEVNNGVQGVLKSIAFSQMFLGTKMSDALKAYLEYLCLGAPSGPTEPSGPIEICGSPECPSGTYYVSGIGCVICPP